MTNDGTFLLLTDFEERYKIKPKFLSFMGIISTVKQLWNKFKPETLREDSNYDNFRPIFFRANKPSKVVYQKLLNKKRKLPQKGQKKWSIDCMCEQKKCVDWKAVYQQIFNVPKFQNF